MEIEETAFLVDLKATFMVVFLCSKSDVYSSPPKNLILWKQHRILFGVVRTCAVQIFDTYCFWSYQ